MKEAGAEEGEKYVRKSRKFQRTIYPRRPFLWFVETRLYRGIQFSPMLKLSAYLKPKVGIAP